MRRIKIVLAMILGTLGVSTAFANQNPEDALKAHNVKVSKKAFQEASHATQDY